MRDNLKVLLVGTGPTAMEHFRALKALGASLVVVGRSAEGAERFQSQTNHPAQAGGVLDYLRAGSELPRKALVCVGIEELREVGEALLDHGVKELLLEKPGALDLKSLKGLKSRAEERGARVWIAYNRRFYGSVRRCREMISEDGGVLSFHFDFTELAFRIGSMGKSPRTLAHWFEANSTHIVDLAFFLGGEPTSLQARVASHLDWHPRGSRFVGHGQTEHGALFSYHANWDAPGRWSVELVTSQRKLVLCPVEKLQVQTLGTFQLETQDGDSLDEQYKPGFFRQCQSFLEQDDSQDESRCDLMTLEQQIVRFERVYSRICPSRP